MSRKRLKTGERAITFAISLSEGELEELDRDARMFDPTVSGESGNRSAFIRRLFRAWKKRIQYSDGEAEEQLKAS